METWIKHLAISGAFIALAYLIYIVLFRKEVNFKQRRFYLLAAVAVSFLVPFSNSYLKFRFSTSPETVAISTPVLETRPDIMIEKPIDTNSTFQFSENLPTENPTETAPLDWLKLLTYYLCNYFGRLSFCYSFSIFAVVLLVFELGKNKRTVVLTGHQRTLQKSVFLLFLDFHSEIDFGPQRVG